MDYGLLLDVDGSFAPGATLGDPDLSLPVTQALFDVSHTAQFAVDSTHYTLYIAQCIQHFAQGCNGKRCL